MSSSLSISSALRNVSPEVSQALVAPKERAEHGGVDDEHIAGACAARRHPHERVELLVARFDERMRSRQVDGLFGEDVDGPARSARNRVMRKVHVKAEVRHPREEATL